MWRVCIAMLLATVSLCAGAQSPGVSEAALKSTLFFKLPQFVYRPDEARDRPLSVCLLGNSEFQSAFEKLAQTPIDGRAVKFSKLAAVSDASRCDFIFITQSESAQLVALLRNLAGLPVVTVSEISGFAKAGGMVELALGGAGSPVSILINRQAAQQKNIEFNAQLLRLAKVVEPGT